MRYLIILFFSFSYIVCNAQAKQEEIYTIKTNDKQTIVGQLKKITKDSIIVNSEKLGIIGFSRDQILSFHTGKLSPMFINNSEPYFVHTGIPNGRGNHYYRNYAIFGHNASFGIDDHLDLSFGFESYSLIFESYSGVPIFHVGAKYSGSVGNGLSIGLSGKAYFNNHGGILFINVPVTIGRKRSNITISPGISRTNGETYFFPFYNFNLALSKKLRLVADGLYIDETLTGAILLEIESFKKINFMVGIGHFHDFYDTYIIPNIAFSVPFGGANKQY